SKPIVRALLGVLFSDVWGQVALAPELNGLRIIPPMFTGDHKNIAQARSGIQRFFTFGKAQGDVAQNDSHFIRFEINSIEPDIGKRRQCFIVNAPEPAMQIAISVVHLVDGVGQLFSQQGGIFGRAIETGKHPGTGQIDFEYIAQTGLDFVMDFQAGVIGEALGKRALSAGAHHRLGDAFEREFRWHGRWLFLKNFANFKIQQFERQARLDAIIPKDHFAHQWNFARHGERGVVMVGQGGQGLFGAVILKEIAKDVIEAKEYAAQYIKNEEDAKNDTLNGRRFFNEKARRDTVINRSKNRNKAQKHDEKQNIRAADAAGKHDGLLHPGKGASLGVLASKIND
ncbi:MAG: hypothetical protein IJC63_01920, partial [Myxococcaceae bacterium]|nr:hypothetical protein [Myxococcaceae bacterium]